VQEPATIQHAMNFLKKRSLSFVSWNTRENAEQEHAIDGSIRQRNGRRLDYFKLNPGILRACRRDHRRREIQTDEMLVTFVGQLSQNSSIPTTIIENTTFIRYPLPHAPEVQRVRERLLRAGRVPIFVLRIQID